MVVNNLISNLMELGFTEYEAKAYIALIKSNPSTAYEIAKSSDIPTSKIYEVIARLLEKETILAINDNDKKRYAPCTPEQLLENRKIKFDSTIDFLREDLKNVSDEINQFYIWNITDYDFLIEKAKKMIMEAKNSILLSTWPEELSLISDLLKKKRKKGLKISIVHFGKIGVHTGQIFQHPIEDTLYNEKGGRGFTIVTDAAQALMGTIQDKTAVEGAWSLNKGFVILAEDYIKHDIYIMKIVKRFDKLLIKKFGPKYKKLRDIWNDEEEES